MPPFPFYRITVPAKVTFADRSAEPAEPVWFFGGVGYVHEDDPRLRRYQHQSTYVVEQVAAVPPAYRQAIVDLPDEDRNRIGAPLQDAAMPGRHIREPFL